MGRSKRKLPAAVTRGAKVRHKRSQRAGQQPETFTAIKPPLPISNTAKYTTYFELVDTEKKKKLEIENTCNRDPPNGYQFVASGDPDLTTACKELSRERGFKILIVSQSKHNKPLTFANQLNRIGYHFRSEVVREAITSGLNQPDPSANRPWSKPEPIPDNLEEYHCQVNAAMRDFFPRIPNEDRTTIIQRAFTLRPDRAADTQPIGLQSSVSLPRRVQLAVLAHIRHTHTRYDDLLKVMTWQDARAAVQSPCLDILVKWRGDEENGRDELEEILREVIVISDSEEDDSDGESYIDESDDESLLETPRRVDLPSSAAQPDVLRATSSGTPAEALEPKLDASARTVKRTPKDNQKARRGFERYRRAWAEAVQRNQDSENMAQPPLSPIGGDPHGRSAVEDSNAYGIQPRSGSRANESYSCMFNSKSQAIPPWQIGHAPNVSTGRDIYEMKPTPHQQAFEDCEPYRHPSPVCDRLQDMLVRSVEPTNEESRRSSLAPGKPDRQTDSMDYGYIVGRSEGDALHAPSYAPQYRGDWNLPGRQVIANYQFDGHVTQVHRGIEDADRARGVCDRISGTVIYPEGSRRHSPWPRLNTARGDEGFRQPSQVSADRLVVNASWPGSRSTRILMEDRGGFFEKVEAPPEAIISRLEARNPYEEVPGSGQHTPRACHNHYTYSQDASSQFVPERQTFRDRQAQLIHEPQAAVSLPCPHNGPVSYRATSSQGYEIGIAQTTNGQNAVGLSHQPVYRQHDVPSPLVPTLQQASQQRPHAVVIPHGHYEPQYRHYGKRPRPDFHHEDFGRRHPPHVSFRDYASAAR